MLDSHVVAEIRVLEARVKDATDGANGLADALAAALERCRVLEAIVVKEAQAREKAEAELEAYLGTVTEEREAREKAEAELAAFVDYFDTWDVSPPQLTRLLNELRVAGRESGGTVDAGNRPTATAAKSAARFQDELREAIEREARDG
jgi:hypothetical protein